MLKKELDTVMSAVRQAGEAIIRIADEQYKIAEKAADKDVLTAADLEADILRELTGVLDEQHRPCRDAPSGQRSGNDRLHARAGRSRRDRR